MLMLLVAVVALAVVAVTQAVLLWRAMEFLWGPPERVAVARQAKRKQPKRVEIDLKDPETRPEL